MGGEGPKRTQRGEARDAALRARAATLFLERGYDSVTIDEIVREVGGSKASVYSFYGGKDGLFLAVMDETIIDLTAPLKQLQLGALPLDQGLRTFAETLFSILLQERHLAFQRLVIAEALRHPQIGQSWFLHGPAETRAVLERFLAELRSRGALRPEIDPAQAAVLFHDMVIFDILNRAMMRIGGGPSPDDVAATITGAIRIFIAGVV